MKSIKIRISDATVFVILTSFLCGFIRRTIMIYGIILFHELGHILISLLLGYKIREVEILPFGGVTKISCHINSPSYKMLLISVSGILFQFILFLVGKIFSFSQDFFLYNQILIIFNLLPIIPLDGSKILFEIINYFISFKKAVNIYIIISFISMITFFICNVVLDINNYLIIILFVYKGIEMIKNRKILFSKFIIERGLYDFYYPFYDNNKPFDKFNKNTKYYFYKEGVVLEDRDIIKRTYNI